MHYEIYKNARDASWRFLLQHKICSLPVDLRHITSDMGIIVKKDDIGTLGADERGLNQLNKAFLYSACQITIEQSPPLQLKYSFVDEAILTVNLFNPELVT